MEDLRVTTVFVANVDDQGCCQAVRVSASPMKDVGLRACNDVVRSQRLPQSEQVKTGTSDGAKECNR